MSKKTTGTDIGYRTYFAAFAVMIIIVIAAVCVLSGCLDEMIFNANAPTAGEGQLENDPADTSAISDTPDTSSISDESDSSYVDTKKESEPLDFESEKDTEKESEKEKDTTKTPEVTTPEVTTSEVKTPEVTTPEVTTPEVTTPEVTTPEVTTPEETSTKAEEYNRNEVFTEQDNNILYSYDDDGLIITGYDGAVTKLTIAKELDGVEVVSIGARAFEGLGSVVEARISAGVKSIGSKAFANCYVLNYVFIPSSVKDIATNAFEGSADVIIYGIKGSYAEHFASDNGIQFREE